MFRTPTIAPLTLLTIDDHPVVLSGLRLLFKGDPRFEVCGIATTPAEACSQAEALQPDMVVTDLVLGGADGVALIGALRGLVPNASILVYSSHDEMLWARHVLRAGALGYVSKAEPLDTVAVALAAIAEGDVYVSAAVQQLLDAHPGNRRDSSGHRVGPVSGPSLSRKCNRGTHARVGSAARRE